MGPIWMVHGSPHRARALRRRYSRRSTHDLPVDSLSSNGPSSAGAIAYDIRVWPQSAPVPSAPIATTSAVTSTRSRVPHRPGDGKAAEIEDRAGFALEALRRGRV